MVLSLTLVSTRHFWLKSVNSNGNPAQKPAPVLSPPSSQHTKCISKIFPAHLQNETRHILCPVRYDFIEKLNMLIAGKGKGKGIVHPRTGHSGPQGEYKYSAILYLIFALDESGWSKPLPGCFTHRKETRYPLYRRSGGPQGRSGRVRKISPPPGFDPRTVQPVASRCTD